MRTCMKDVVCMRVQFVLYGVCVNRYCTVNNILEKEIPDTKKNWADVSETVRHEMESKMTK